MHRAQQWQQHDAEQLNAAAHAFRSGDLNRAETLFRDIVTRHPQLADAHYALARIALLKNAAPRGLEHLDAALRLQPTNPTYHFARARLLSAESRFQEALDAYTTTTSLDPTNADAHAEAAGILERFSRFDDAAAAVEHALKANSNHEKARVFKARLALRTGPVDDQHLRQLVQTLRPIATNSRQRFSRSIAWAALAEIYDKLRDAPAAFEAFGRANDLERELQHAPPPAEREKNLASITRIAAAVSPEKTRRWRDEAPDDGLPNPVLLVGFPRSGTTMTERALSAHPRIRAIEERPTFEDTRDEMFRLCSPSTGRRDFHEITDALTTDQLVHLRRFYWQRAAREIDADQPPTDAVILDKLPLRILLLPFVNRLFPDARVIVALRDPRDVCLSCFRQRFTIHLSTSYFLDINDTARFYAHTMRAWLGTRNAYSFPWLEIRYEDTVTDFESRIRDVLAFLSLEWSDDVLSFYERTDEQLTRTPNYHAIRVPVNTKAVGRWHAYAEQLAPVLPTLQPLIAALGYE